MSAHCVDELTEAARDGDQARLEALLADGVGVNEVDTDGDTALLMAAMEGDMGCLKVRLAAGAYVDFMREDGGWTPLMVSASEGHLECVKVLVAAGALLHLEDEEGRTAEDLAWAMAEKEVEAFLAATRREQRAAWEAKRNAERLAEVLPEGPKENEKGRL